MTTNVGFRSRASSKVQLTTVFVVLMALQTPMFSVARFQVWRPSEHLNSRGTLEKGLNVDLMQYHHVNSPYATPNLTLAQRVEIAVKSSQERARFFHSHIYGSSSKFGSEDSFSSPVFSSQGSYVMQISLGTPARKFTAIADTGSDLVWIQCAPCTQCFSQPDPMFNPSSSSSYKLLPCTGTTACSDLPRINQPCSSSSTCLYEYAYGDQSSTEGDLASDTVALGGGSFLGVAIGCGHKNQGTFQSADGLVGLGQGPLSLVSQIGSQIGNVFSYCLTSFYSSTTTTSQLVLGGTGTGSLTYTPLTTNSVNPTFYYVTVTGISVGGTPLSYPAAAFEITSEGGGGMILDSGTTVTQMDTRAYTPFVDSLASLIDYPRVDGSSAGFDLCYDLSGVSDLEFPAVNFYFEGLTLSLPADNVFLQVDNNPDYCLAFQGSNLGLSIFGNLQQQNFQIAYDRANKRVGFAATTC